MLPAWTAQCPDARALFEGLMRSPRIEEERLTTKQAVAALCEGYRRLMPRDSRWPWLTPGEADYFRQLYPEERESDPDAATHPDA